MLESKNVDGRNSYHDDPDPLWMRGIAHDFCNLIQTTRGTLELLQYDMEPDCDSGRIELALFELDKMAELAQRLQEDPAQIPMPWSVVKRHIMDAARVGTQTSNVAWTITDDPGLPSILATPSDLGRIFLNLTWNACEALQGSGTITIRATVTHASPHAQGHHPDTPPSPGSARSWLALEFSDNGVGMNSDQLTHLFDPYYSTKASGRGLGLPTVRALVRRHGGSIEVESQKGKGTTFRLYFPGVEST